jgi:hypothetical protein
MWLSERRLQEIKDDVIEEVVDELNRSLKQSFEAIQTDIKKVRCNQADLPQIRREVASLSALKALPTTALATRAELLSRRLDALESFERRFIEWVQANGAFTTWLAGWEKDDVQE